jgi:hypothetical protein
MSLNIIRVIKSMRVGWTMEVRAEGCEMNRESVENSEGRRLLGNRTRNWEEKLRGLQPASELYRPSDRPLLTKLVPTFADRGCHVVSATGNWEDNIEMGFKEIEIDSHFLDKFGKPQVCHSSSVV